ncbi:hypothetical protein QJS10_CPA08g00440 [Acorus calamus]|uniref:Uncharacterized protein n=1 Tax=Acorus calamus TaxID=4465 RepID=A0AAV9EBN9_ACOCL|nr:hypothetical protein QJS10_CPA08g00440 [Acorus calamus]
MWDLRVRVKKMRMGKKERAMEAPLLLQKLFALPQTFDHVSLFCPIFPMYATAIVADHADVISSKASYL